MTSGTGCRTRSRSPTGLLRAPRIPFRLFYAHLATAMREIAQSAFFNPLSALEFRPEFDRIASPQVLELIQSVPRRAGAPASSRSPSSRSSACSATCASRRHRARPHRPPRRRARLPGLRGAAQRRARALQLPAPPRRRASRRELRARALPRAGARPRARATTTLLAEGHRLVGDQGRARGLAANLRLEMRRTFEHDLPARRRGHARARAPRALRARDRATCAPRSRTPSCSSGRSLGVRLEEGRVFDDQAARRATSERLRRDVWMFAQIARAFASKARHTDASTTAGRRSTTSRSCASSSATSAPWATRCSASATTRASTASWRR